MTNNPKPLPTLAEEKSTVYLEPIAIRANTVAQMLDISRPKVYELAAREDFRGVFKFGGCTLFSVEALKDWVREQCEKGAIE